MKHHQPLASLSTCPHEVFKDCIAHGVMSRFGRKVTRPREQLSCDRGHSNAYILEYADAEGRTIGRMVKACGHVECWLRSDIATDTLIARADAVAADEAMRKRVLEAVGAGQRVRDQRAETYVLSSALVHAAARRQATLGRLYDMNSRGDRVRGNLVAALDRAVKAEGAK